jgi:transcriptional regulator with XRE-family HTH domain
MKRFGEKLRLLRKRAGLSQAQVADRLGVNQSHVARIEKGLKPSVDLILQIADIFGVTTDQLMRDELDLD